MPKPIRDLLEADQTVGYSRYLIPLWIDSPSTDPGDSVRSVSSTPRILAETVRASNLFRHRTAHSSPRSPSVAYCGNSRPNSSEPGVCGGAGATCYHKSMCATASCDSYTGQCIAWQDCPLNTGDPCTYSVQCSEGLACEDNGLGQASCDSITYGKARVCERGWEGSCADDRTYKSCGYARNGSSETGVCGGQTATCTSGSVSSFGLALVDSRNSGLGLLDWDLRLELVQLRSRAHRPCRVKADQVSLCSFVVGSQRRRKTRDRIQHAYIPLS